jgi:hypothetical protein
MVRLSYLLTFFSFFSKFLMLLRPRVAAGRVELPPYLLSPLLSAGEDGSLLLLNCLEKRLLSDILIIIDL